MINFSIGLKIQRPADIVYKAFIDPDNMLKWRTDLVWFEPVKGKYAEFGSVARFHYKSGNKSYILEDRLEYIESGKKLISSINGSPFEARIEVIFNADDWQTELIMNWSGKGSSLLSKLTMRFSEQKIKLQTENELAKFKDLVESFGVKFR